MNLLLSTGKISAKLEATDSNGITGLGWACRAGYTDIVRFVIGKGALINTEDKTGNDINP